MEPDVSSTSITPVTSVAGTIPSQVQSSTSPKKLDSATKAAVRAGTLGGRKADASGPIPAPSSPAPATDGEEKVFRDLKPGKSYTTAIWLLEKRLNLLRKDQIQMAQNQQQLAMILVQLQAHVKPTHEFMQKCTASTIFGNFQMKMPETIDPLPAEELKKVPAECLHVDAAAQPDPL